MNKSKESLINSACDLFGYGEDDFDGMNYIEIWQYLSYEKT